MTVTPVSAPPVGGGGVTPSAPSVRASRSAVDIRELGLIDYEEAWGLQRQLAQARADADEDGQDALLLLEHPSVYTAGRRTEQSDLPFDGSHVVDVDRGGKITWHGPGQLVGYPIVKLAEPIDVISYVRRLEEALIAACAHFGVTAVRVEGRSGVWLPAGRHGAGGHGASASSAGGLVERKIGSIGVRVQRGVTLHGFSLNCDADLSAFANIVPCGIQNVGSTSLSIETERRVTVAEALPMVAERVLAALDGKPPTSS